jgi:hypothetical protein
LVHRCEINNNYFTVEKSSDGVQYLDILTIQGAGNSTIQHNYSCTDGIPFVGINYYRIKQTDYDGRTDYSKVVVLNISKVKKSITIYPTPVRDDFINIRFEGSEREKTQIDLLDKRGAVLKHESFKLGNNYENVQYSFPPEMNPGAYFIHITSETYSKTQKIIFLSH